MTCPACGAAGADDGAICASCGKVLDPSGRLPLGYVLAGRYELRRFLGEGGMGTVYEGYDRKLEDRVALKILKADFAHSVEMEKRFRHEIRLARRLRHPNVCAIHEYGEAGPLRYIAMELIEGTDLKHRLRDRGALSAAEGFRIAIQIAHGLDCIHKAGVVHRDLKAANVMLDRNGDVRLMDFGIAKQIGPEATLGATAVGSIIGTPEYMSPEQGRGETIDFRSDLYSLGIVVYEVFTGDVPFRGDTPIATIFKMLQEPVDLDSPRAIGIPGTLKPVLMRALAKSAEDRFATAEEMAAALAAARDAALGPGTTILPQHTRIEHPSTLVDGSGRHTPTPAGARPWSGTPVPTTPAPPISTTPAPWQAAVPTQVTPAPPVSSWQAAPTRPEPVYTAHTPPRHPPEPVGSRSLVPALLAGVGLVLLIVAGGVAIYFWPRSTPAPSTTPVETTVAEPTPAPSLAATPGPYDDLLTTSTPPPTTVFAAPSPEPSIAPPKVTTAAVVPTALPTARPTPTPRPPPPPTLAAAPGQLQLYVKPWAYVTVDGKEVGQTPMAPLSLSAGPHQVRLSHRAFEPVTREVVIEPGKTTRIEMDFNRDGRRVE